MWENIYDLIVIGFSFSFSAEQGFITPKHPNLNSSALFCERVA